jgi:hypothetical protein
MKRFLYLAAAGAAAALLLAGAGGAGSSAPSANPTTQGKVLVQRFFTLLHDGNTKGLSALLTPGFQAVRANGGVQNKASYLANPPKVGSFTIAKLKGTRSGSIVLVVSYQVTVTETIGGSEQPTGPSPRLSVFQWQKGAWHLAAHANFGAIKK